MSDDLLECALAAVTCFFDGRDKSKLDLRTVMTDLRCAVHQEQKRRSQDETTVFTKPQPVIGIVTLASPSPPPIVIRPPPFTPGNQPHG